MSCIVYQVNKKTGEKYAYESVSYWAKEKKQPRSKRRYIGKVDPVTGEIIKSRKAPVPLPDTDTEEGRADTELLRRELARKDALIASLRNDLDILAARYDEAVETIREISALSRAFEGKKNV